MVIAEENQITTLIMRTTLSLSYQPKLMYLLFQKTGLNFDFLWKYFVGLNSLWDTLTIIINRNASFCILEQKVSEFVECEL